MFASHNRGDTLQSHAGVDAHDVLDAVREVGHAPGAELLILAGDAADLIALRRVPARFFGVFMSVNPVIAAVAGIVLLGQVLDLHEWVGIVIVVSANALAVATSGSRQQPHVGVTSGCHVMGYALRKRP